MYRLTTNKPVEEMDMVELAHNSCFVKDRQAMYRDYDGEYDARDLARFLLKELLNRKYPENNVDFDCVITESLLDDIATTEGLIALFYRNLWAMAELHGRLKYYEDLEESGRLAILPEGEKKTLFLKALAYSAICPDSIGMKNSECGETDCVDCWEAAITGGTNDNR